ncbi:MAG: radical SAM protein [Elusimicrobia bacterium]|nr:radical SAM protein [Elusimicrobiota bacterium]
MSIPFSFYLGLARRLPRGMVRMPAAFLRQDSEGASGDAAKGFAMRQALILGLRTGLDRSRFRRRFGGLPEEAFPAEFRFLREAGRLVEGPRTVRALSASPEEYLAVALHFYPKPVLAAAARRCLAARTRVEAHEAYKGRDLLLRPTAACNQRCPFCFVRRGGPTPPAEIAAALKGIRGKLAPGETLTVSGGEPLTDPRLAAILRSARRRGVREFVLQTNAVGLERRGRLAELLRLGVRHYFVSFHSHKPAHYDRITGSKGLHPRAVRALAALLAEPGCLVTLHAVVNAWNYRDLPGLARFLGRLARKSRAKGPVTAAFSMMNGVGHEKAPFMAVDLAAAAPWLDRAVSACVQEGLAVHPFAGETTPPPCVLSDPGLHVSPREFPQEGVRYVEAVPGRALEGGRVKRPSCRACPYDRRCLGVPAEYVRLFGAGALGLRSVADRPIHRERGPRKPGLTRRKTLSHQPHASQ